LAQASSLADACFIMAAPDASPITPAVEAGDDDEASPITPDADDVRDAYVHGVLMGEPQASG